MTHATPEDLEARAAKLMAKAGNNQDRMAKEFRWSARNLRQMAKEMREFRQMMAGGQGANDNGMERAA